MNEDATVVALDFTRALCSRDYEGAYAMTASAYRDRLPLSEMRAAFEATVPTDWGDTEPVEVGMTLTEWPTKKPDDVLWVYVSIYGDVYSEGLTVAVTAEAGALRVGDVEWGRP